GPGWVEYRLYSLANGVSDESP
ncbi:DUF3237 domain-containing protein, partial [Pseudomonas sp. ATCC 13867]